MPGPILFPLFAVAHLAIAIVALSLVPREPVGAICLAVVELITFYDNLIVSVGNRFGPGARCRRLNLGRFFLHGTFISLLLPVYVVIGQCAGVSMLTTPAATVVVWAATVLIAIVGFEFGFRRLGPVMPVDYFGCLRYAQSVGASTRRADYAYSSEELGARARPPLASILTVLIGLLIALWVALAASVWLPFVVTAIMFSAASFPIKTWGPLATSVVEVLFSAGLVYTLASVVARC